MEYIVPLGSNCTISQYLRRTNKRTMAFPFDWNVVPIQSAIDLIKTDFEHFLDEKHLTFLPKHEHRLCDDFGNDVTETAETITPCVCKRYNMLFPHDFSKQGRANLPKVLDKYDKRINRLLDLLNEANNTFVFIAYDGKVHNWQREQYSAAKMIFKNQYTNWKADLRSMLSVKYPKLSYKMYDLREYKDKKELNT